jgi:hypothetical protein
MLKVLPSIKKSRKYGSTIYFQTSFEQISVEETNNRFINIPRCKNPNVFDNQRFVATFKYSFENYDILHFHRWKGWVDTGSWKMNVNDTKRNFPSLDKLNFNHKIDANGKVVLATILKAKCC